MTTIAYRDGMIAADTGMTSDGMRCGEAEKIARNQAGDLAGACGNAAYVWAFLKWFAAGEKGDPPAVNNDDDDYGVIYRAAGTIEGYTKAGKSSFKAPYHASGSGCELAMGAMAHRALADEAVRAAMAHDPSTFGSVMTLRHWGSNERVVL